MKYLKNPTVYPIVFETFKNIGEFEVSQLRVIEPKCFNSIVMLRKYKITIEEIEEPIEVLQKRLQGLWDKNDNYHNWNALKEVAKSINYEIKRKV